jgi:hypothetical protein
MFKIETNTIEINSHNVHANFWVEYNGFSFPEKNWSDFILPVLLWWSDEALKFNSKQNQSHRFLFMDGAFEFIVRTSASQADIFNVDFIEREGDEPNVLKTISIQKKVFINELISKNRELIDNFNGFNWPMPKDLEKLVASNKKLLASQER